MTKDECYKKYVLSSDIDQDYHNNVFDQESYRLITSTINLDCFEKRRNRLYWLSSTIFHIAVYKCLLNKWKADNSIDELVFLIYQPFLTLTIELCKLMNASRVYYSFLALICRQLVEQICLVKELKEQNIPFSDCLIAAAESHNKQINAQRLNIANNTSNAGLLKVFKQKTSYGDLVKKHYNKRIYTLISGDVHTISSLEKMLPKFNSHMPNKYDELYLKTVEAILHDCLDFIYEIDETTKKLDLQKIKEEIKENTPKWFKPEI